MSIFEQLIEKPAIIIDIGHAYTKCGFAGEAAPFAIISTPRTSDGSSIFDLKSEDDVERKQTLVDLIYRIYYKILNANTRERKLVVVESIFTPVTFRRVLAQILFANFQCLSVAFMPSHLSAFYTLALTRALVVDCGYIDCQIVPIAEGIPMCGLCDFANLGAKRIHEEIETLIRNYCSVSIGGNRQVKFTEASPQPILSEKTLEEIKIKCCFVTSFERAREIYSQVEKLSQNGVDFYDKVAQIEFKFAPNCDYPLDSRTILHIPGWVRELACEAVFVNRLDSHLTLPRLIVDSLSKAPIDLKRDFAANIVLIGGGFMLTGFKNRLADEIKSLVSQDGGKLLPFAKVAYHKPPSHDNYTAWLGAAIFGSLDILDLYAVHLNKFKETQKLPDWFQITPSHKSDMLSI